MLTIRWSNTFTKNVLMVSSNNKLIISVARSLLVCTEIINCKNFCIGAGINIINLRRTWEKLLLAARAIVAIEHPSEVFVISCRPFGQRAVLKFAAHTGATPIAGRFTPGAFTNQIQVFYIFVIFKIFQF